MRVKFKKQISMYKFYRTLRVAREESLSGYHIHSYFVKEGSLVAYKHVEFYFQGFLYRCVYDYAKPVLEHVNYYRYNLKELK